MQIGAQNACGGIHGKESHDLVLFHTGQYEMLQRVSDKEIR